MKASFHPAETGKAFPLGLLGIRQEAPGLFGMFANSLNFPSYSIFPELTGSLDIGRHLGTFQWESLAF